MTGPGGERKELKGLGMSKKQRNTEEERQKKKETELTKALTICQGKGSLLQKQTKRMQA